MSILEEFVEWVRSKSSITDIVQYKIAPVGEMPQKLAEPPYLLYQFDPRHDHSADGYEITEGDVTMHCYGDGFMSSYDLGNAVFNAIGSYFGPLVTGGRKASCMVTDMRYIFEPPRSAQEEGKHRHSMSVQLWYCEVQPTLT